MTFNKAVISSQKIDYVQNRCFTVVDCNENKTCMIQGSTCTESKINCAQYNQGTEITATVNTNI